MKKKSYLRPFLTKIVLTGLLFIMVDSGLGQSTINWRRMQRDLDIMEGVLNKLLAGESRMWGSNARGVYFDGYGVIFQIDEFNQGLDLQVAVETVQDLDRVKEDTKPRLNKSEEGVVVVDSRRERVKTYKLARSKRIATLKDRCTEFLGNYADAIGQLQPTDKITVLINLNGRGSAFYTIVGANAIHTTDQPSVLEVSAPKSAIMAYRNGSIDSKAFASRLVLNENKTDQHMQQNIDIMAQIMDTALGRKYHEDFSVRDNRGIYIKGLGALFFLRGDIHAGREAWAPAVLENYLKGQEVSVSVRPTKTSTKKPEEVLENFKSALVEIVADYGHTLRTLKANEHVVAIVDFDSWPLRLPVGESASRSALPNRLIMKVAKDVLDKYGKGEIKLAALQKKIVFQEY
ncbi:MAG: hypothetical protein ACE5G1_11230 [bacterium]